MKSNNKSNHKKFKKISQQNIYEQFNKQAKEEKKKDKNPYLTSISDKLKLPADILLGGPIITATGRYELCLENYKGIIEYNDQLIKVQTKVCKIYIEGSKLHIDYFTNEEMKISGCIDSIHYK